MQMEFTEMIDSDLLDLGVECFFSWLLSIICTMLLIHLGLHFPLQPCPGRLARVPWTLYFLIIFATVVTGP